MQPSTRPRNDLPEGDALNAGGLGHYARGWKVSSGHAGPSGPQSTLVKAVVSLGPGACGLRRRFDLSASSLPICVPRLLGCWFFFLFFWNIKSMEVEEQSLKPQGMESPLQG